MKRLFTLLLPIALSALVSPAYAKDPLVQMLPVRTPGMSPGQVARKAITQSVGQPLF
ncbi:conjugal transfer protein, partial [Vibrio parahaemolyticus]